jgi:hypothetical protein
MYQITKISIELLSTPELFKARDAMKVLEDLDIREMDVDAKHLVQDLINKRTQGQE